MTKCKLKYFLLFILCFSVVSFAACKKEAPVSNSHGETPATQTPKPEEKPDTDTPQDEEGTPVDIYGMNEDSLESEPAHSIIKGTVTAETVVQAVVDDFKKHSVEIGIDSVIEEDKKVIVSFQQTMAPVSNVGSDVEETILNCISDSLMDNLDSCESVIYRVEGNAYESGHFAFDLNEVYASK